MLSRIGFDDEMVEDIWNCQMRVEKGAVWMDEHAPHWFEDIAQKLGLFNIQSISYCILGLTFESYVNVVSTKYGYPELTQKQAEDFGFNRSNPYNREWVILESIWLDEIQNRMEALNDANG